MAYEIVNIILFIFILLIDQFNTNLKCHMAVITSLGKRSSERWTGSLGSINTIVWGCAREDRQNSGDITIAYIYISVNVNWLLVIVDAGL